MHVRTCVYKYIYIYIHIDVYIYIYMHNPFQIQEFTLGWWLYLLAKYSLEPQSLSKRKKPSVSPVWDLPILTHHYGNHHVLSSVYHSFPSYSHEKWWCSIVFELKRCFSHRKRWYDGWSQTIITFTPRQGTHQRFHPPGETGQKTVDWMKDGHRRWLRI